MSWGEVFKITSCRLVVIGKVASLVGATVSITDGVVTTTGVFGSDLVLSFELASRKTYTVSAGGFSKVIKPKAGDFLEVELGAFDRLWLYDRGKFNTNVNSFLIRFNDGLAALRTPAEVVTYEGAGIGIPATVTSSKIDLTDWNTVWIGGSPTHMGIGICHVYTSPTGSGGYPTASALAKPRFCKMGSTMIPLDISGVTGEHFIGVHNFDGTTNQGTSIKQMWLSKDKVKPLIPKSASLSWTGGSLAVSSEYSTNVALNMLKYLDTYDGFWGGANWLSAEDSPWVEVTFATPKKVNLARLDINYQYYFSKITVQGSNDGVNYTKLGETDAMSNTQGLCVIPLINDNYYTKYRFVLLGKVNTYYGATGIQLYEYDNPDKIYNDLTW